MDRLDEIILKLKNARPENQPIIEDGMYIKDELVTFVPVPVLEGTYTVMLPTDFSIMSKEDAEYKFPLSPRPKEIWSSPGTETNFCISYFDNIEINAEHIDEEADSLKQVLKKTNPAMDFYESGIYDLPDLKIAWFDYNSFGIDGDMYNIMFVSSVEGKLLHGAFICQFEDFEAWIGAAHQMIQSIRAVPLT